MFKRIDQSEWLSNLLSSTSDFFSKNVGLLVIFGLILIVVSLIVQSVDVYVESKLLALIGIWTHHLGVLIAFISMLVASALGR